MLLEPKIRNVIDSDDGEKSKRLVLLNLDIQTEGRRSPSSLPKASFSTGCLFSVEYLLPVYRSGP